MNGSTILTSALLIAVVALSIALIGVVLYRRDGSERERVAGNEGERRMLAAIRIAKELFKGKDDETDHS